MRIVYLHLVFLFLLSAFSTVQASVYLPSKTTADYKSTDPLNTHYQLVKGVVVGTADTVAGMAGANTNPLETVKRTQGDYEQAVKDRQGEYGLVLGVGMPLGGKVVQGTTKGVVNAFGNKRVPNKAANDLLANPDQRFTDRVKDTHCIDCDDLARDFYKASGENGQILDLTVPSGEIKVKEFGQVENFVDHRVYSDGNFVFDPRYSGQPVPINQYIDELKVLNPDLVIKDVTPK